MSQYGKLGFDKGTKFFKAQIELIELSLSNLIILKNFILYFLPQTILFFLEFLQFITQLLFSFQFRLIKLTHSS